MMEFNHYTFEKLIDKKAESKFKGIGLLANQYLKEGEFPIVDQGKSLTSGFTNDKSKIIDVENPIIIFGDHTRIFKFIDFDFAPGADGTKVIVPNYKLINPKLFYLLLKNSFIPNDGYGRHYKYLKELEFQVPKKFEEQKLVAELLSNKLTSVEQMRQAALKQKEAVEALQGALLREVFPYKQGEELPKGWKWVKIKDVTHFKNGLNYSESDVMQGVKIVGVSCFKKHFYVKEELLDEVSAEIVRENDFLQDGDLIVVRSNGNPELVGRHIIFRGESRITNSGFTIRMRLNTDELYPEFYLLYAKSTPFREQIKGQGSNISNLSQEKLKKVILSAPKSTDEQKNITDRFLIKLEKLEELKFQITTQLEAIEAMPAAILREVFEFNTNNN
jgi:type I restriction enzyme S subunit